MITTDDGSYADRGFVTDKLRQLIENGTRIDLVIAVGPIVMMKAVSEMTRKENIHTVVSLNPIMIDGTGMCGGCRVLIDGKSEFACVDGPEFDAAQSGFLRAGAAQRDVPRRRAASIGRVSSARKAAEDEARADTNRDFRAKEINDEPRAPASRKIRLAQGPYENSAPGNARASAEQRAHNFEEVNLGYSAELAQQEALRCLECAKPTCTDKCPVGVSKGIRAANRCWRFSGRRSQNLVEDNVLPAITGRVCPQENQCEGKCLMEKKVKSLGIGYLERFVADYEQKGTHVVPRGRLRERSRHRGKRAVRAHGGGRSDPEGPSVRVFEALHEIGGVLVYGIPEFRLPKQIMREQIDYMREMGVEFETDVVVGRTVTIDELMEEEGYDAVFIGTGAGLPQFMGIPGEHLNGVYSANEFLTRINLMKAYEFPLYDEPMLDLRGKDVP